MNGWTWSADARLVSLNDELDTDVEVEFEARLAEFTQLAFRVAYSVLRHREDAEDVAQEAMLTAYRKCRSLRQRERFRSWVVRIAWREAIDRRRGDARRQRREEQSMPASTPLSPEEMVSVDELKRHLWQAIDELPEGQRTTLVLSEIEGHDTRSVAELLKLPTGTIKSRRHNARKKLLEKLKWIANASRQG